MKAVCNIWIGILAPLSLTGCWQNDDCDKLSKALLKAHCVDELDDRSKSSEPAESTPVSSTSTISDSGTPQLSQFLITTSNASGFDSNNIYSISAYEDQIYLSTHGGISVTSDSGSSWTSIDFGDTGISHNSVGEKSKWNLEVSPNKTFYAIGPQRRLHRSLGVTETFQLVDSSSGLPDVKVYQISFGRDASSEKVLLGTDQGLFQSTDNGQNFAKILIDTSFVDPPEDSAVVGVNFDFENTLVICVQGLGPYVSTDEGDTFAAFDILNNPEFATCNKVFVDNKDIYVGIDGVGYAKSQDRGITWDKFNTGGLLGKSVLEMAFHPNGDIFLATSAGAIWSYDGGESFDFMDEVDGVEMFGESSTSSVYYDPKGGGVFYGLNDGLSIIRRK